MNQNNKYYLPKEEYMTVIHFARQYPTWQQVLSIQPDTIKAITYDGDKVQSVGGYDSTVETAMKRAAIAGKMRLIEETAREAGGDISSFLLIGVTRGTPFYQLRQQGMPCEKDMYYKRRQRFYWLLAQKI